MKKNNKKKKQQKKQAFTLIELLAVIVILGLLMAIAIPSVTKYITQSRKKTVTTTIGNYISALTNQVNDMDYIFTDTNIIYAVPIECISLERGGTNPFGKWHQASNSYWAYVLVQYDDTTSSYTYGFTFKDSAGYGLYPTSTEKLKESGTQIQTGLSLNRPEDGIYTNLTAEENWSNSGFILNASTQISVLEAASEGATGNGVDTCTLCQKGDNYDAVEEEKAERAEALEADSGTLINNGSTNTMVFGKSLNRSTIESITILDTKRVPSDAIEWWDASVEKQNGIKAWIKDADNNGKYELYIGQKGGVTAPADSSYLFYNYSYAKNVDVKKLNTSNVTDMSYMFAINAATELDLSNFDTSNTTSMEGMFMLAANATKIDVSSFNTSKVTSMKGMFGFCQKVKKIDLSHFNVSNVTNMSAMFSQSMMEEINTTGWNTSKVTDMSAMFLSTNMKTMNLNHFNTSNVTTMMNMFSGCDDATSITVSNFNTSKVTDMSGMFSSCSGLTTLNISNFNTSNVTNMSEMFEFCDNLNTLTLGTFNTTKVKDFSWMFYNSPKIKTTIAIRATSVDDYQNMFFGAATDSSSYITVNYTTSTSTLVTNMVNTKSYSTSKVYKGSRVS